MGSHRARVKSRKECRDEFWHHMKSLARYWSRLPSSEVLGRRVPGRTQDVTDMRFEGFLHSMAVAFTGNSGGLSFPVAIIPNKSEEDIKYHQDRDEAYAPAFDPQNDILQDGTFQYDCHLGHSRPGEPGGRQLTEPEIEQAIAKSLA